MSNMKLTKNLGMLLLGMWLIVTGLLQVVSITIPAIGTILLSSLSLLVFQSCLVGKLFGFTLCRFNERPEPAHGTLRTNGQHAPRNNGTPELLAGSVG
jgi:hypothetical protein